MYIVSESTLILFRPLLAASLMLVSDNNFFAIVRFFGLVNSVIDIRSFVFVSDNRLLLLRLEIFQVCKQAVRHRCQL